MEIIYWLILIGWILGLRLLKKDSSFALIPAFGLFVVSAVLIIFNLNSLAEPVMRVSFIGWMVGVTLALVEYIKRAK